MMERAEEKKRQVRQTIDEMRDQYMSLLDRNRALPPNIRLFKKVSVTELQKLLTEIS